MIHSFIFSEGRLVGRDLEIEALRLVRADKGLVLWVDLDEATEDEIQRILSGVFQFHPLAIEDCVTPSSLPKIEDYDDHLFLVSHAVDFTRTEKFHTTELDLFLGKEFIVSFHRRPLRSVQSVIDRVARGTLVARGPDRLAHFLLDGLVDNYKPVIDELRIEIEEIESTILEKSSDDLTPDLLEVRAEIAHLREIIRPQRDMIHRLAHGETRLIRPKLLPYFRDLRDNLVRIDDTASGFADRLIISFDLYLNKSTFAANEGIKVLTALTALSMPAIVIGTWYGMNFVGMPELDQAWGYPAVIGLTALGTGFMFRWCRRRGWI